MQACLESVSDQTYDPIEHIIVDGGSTDGTLDIIHSFEGRQSLKVITGKDQGIYDAVNKGLRIATGDVVGYVNSDDLYLPWSVEVAVERLSSGADLVFGDMAVIEKKNDHSVFWISHYPPFDMDYYTFTSTLGQPSVFWRRSVMERIGYLDISYPLTAECEYWLRASAAGLELSRVDEVMAIQIDHPSTLRATNPYSKYRDEFARMATVYSPKSGRIWTSRPERIRKSFAWRRYQFLMMAASLRASPRRWPRFLGWVRENNISLKRTGLLWRMLPSRLRPGDATLVDVASLEEAL